MAQWGSSGLWPSGALSNCSEFSSWVELVVKYFEYHPSMTVRLPHVMYTTKWTFEWFFSNFGCVLGSLGHLEWFFYGDIKGQAAPQLLCPKEFPHPQGHGIGDEHPLLASFALDFSLCKDKASLLFSCGHKPASWCQRDQRKSHGESLESFTPEPSHQHILVEIHRCRHAQITALALYKRIL